MQIYMWWLDLDLKSKEWLRENLRAEDFSALCCAGNRRAGGPHPDTPQSILTEAEWDFIETRI